MGCTRFAERWDAGLDNLVIQAAYEAYEEVHDCFTSTESLLYEHLGFRPDGGARVSLTKSRSFIILRPAGSENGGPLRRCQREPRFLAAYHDNKENEREGHSSAARFG